MKTSIIIADDHRIFSEGLEALIRAQPDMYPVAIATNGQMALQLTQKHKPDVVVMDISMPEMNGIVATRRIVALTSPPLVVVMSMHADRKYVIEALRAGARGYLLKNCTFPELVAAIRQVRNGQYYLSKDCTGVVVEDIVRNGAPLPASVLNRLTERELAVLQQMVNSVPTKVIADNLQISIKTVETHQWRLKAKLGIHNLVELTKFAISEGLISAEYRPPK
jgi:DNA-binding NarL/FixJ family response regulator